MGHKTAARDIHDAFARYKAETGDAGAHLHRITKPNDPRPSLWQINLGEIVIEIHGIEPTFCVIGALTRSWKEGFAAGREAP
ncbi:MAG: hypothetical protein WA742_09080 [Candidatus Cybelea sp.]